MFWIKVKRIIRAGFFSFWRNGFISLSSILVMIVTLFVIGSVIFSSVVLKTTLDQLRDKVDINVYFITSAKEDDILAMKKNLEQLPEVLPPVEYVSREDELANFKKRHENDQFTLQALEELGENPLGATLNIKAKDPSNYESIARYIDSKTSEAVSNSIIDKVNYYQNKDAIDRLTKIINSANSLGLILTLFLVAISILITFNTIRLVIYMSRDEISVMRLVGASDRYIRGPFFVAGAIYGFLSAIVTLLIFYPVTLWLGGATANFFVGLNIFNYYTENFGEIFLIIVGSGVLIGSISSYLAVRKYLRV
ncbi:MAG TPA: permease-like cell division protein FtsX [Parcubacteria group bacterium]|jgi:cell division transport system permease protein|nr:permease-like cell division protein FtsX [Parcubacteria group bacterium]